MWDSSWHPVLPPFWLDLCLRIMEILMGSVKGACRILWRHWMLRVNLRSMLGQKMLPAINVARNRCAGWLYMLNIWEGENPWFFPRKGSLDSHVRVNHPQCTHEMVMIVSPSGSHRHNGLPPRFLVCGGEWQSVSTQWFGGYPHQHLCSIGARPSPGTEARSPASLERFPPTVHSWRALRQFIHKTNCTVGSRFSSVRTIASDATP